MKYMHPADELAMIRTDIRRLQDREDYLRKGFLSLRFSTRGDDAVATVKIFKEQRFRPDRLPADMANDPVLWETKVTRHVQIDQIGRRGVCKQQAPVDQMIHDVIEQVV